MSMRRLATFVPLALLTACDPAPPDAGNEPAKAQGDAEVGHETGDTPAKADPEVNEDKPEALAPPSKSAGTMAEATNAFGADLYGQLRGEPGNFAISPASVEMALTMTWGGSANQTKAEMAKSMYLEELGDGAHAASAELLAAWARKLEGKQELAVVNRIYTEKTLPVADGFVSLTKEHYGAGWEPANFMGDAEGERTRINAWVEKQTKKKIEELLPDGSLDSDTKMVLVNAIYFLGTWATAFDEGATTDDVFWVKGREEAKVPTMHLTAELRAATHDGVDVLDLPYEGGSLSMILLVPEDKEGLKSLEDKIVAGGVEPFRKKLSVRKAKVALPRFRVKMAGSLKLNEALMALGIRQAFSRGADFSGMTDAKRADDELRIGAVYHQTFVDVNEEGTEAAAATAVVMVPRGMAPPSEIFELTADRPFMFVIRDNHTGTDLFMGRVVDPRLKD